MEQKNIKLFLIIFLIAIIFRIPWVIVVSQFPDRSMTNDSPGYTEPANYLVRYQAYTHPDIERTPTYPLFLALSYWLFGKNQLAVVIFQVVLSLLTIWLTYYLGSLVFDKKTALIGSLLIAISLETIIQPVFILTETLFAFLLILVNITFLLFARQGKIIWLIASGVLMGLTILCRPVALYYLIVLLFLLLLISRANWKKYLPVSV